MTKSLYHICGKYFIPEGFSGVHREKFCNKVIKLTDETIKHGFQHVDLDFKCLRIANEF